MKKLIIGMALAVGFVSVCLAESLVGMNTISVTPQKATVTGTSAITAQRAAVTATAVLTPQTYVIPAILADGTTNTVASMTNGTIVVTVVNGANVMTNASAAVTLVNGAIVTNIVLKLAP